MRSGRPSPSSTASARCPACSESPFFVSCCAALGAVSKARAAGVAVTSDVEAVAFGACGTSCWAVGFGVAVAGPGVEVAGVDVAVVGVDVVGVDAAGVDDVGVDDVGVCALGIAEGAPPL